MNPEETKRLFFGMEVVAPWPKDFPSGRILLESDRHLTLAFLGDNHLPDLLEKLRKFPDPGFRIGIAAMFDRPLFLPHREPKTAGWRVHLMEQVRPFLEFQKHLTDWLYENGFPSKKQHGPFLPHVTISRPPFVIHEWKKAFQQLPLYLKNIHLCESVGGSRYNICWSYDILAPFEAIEHTADEAFIIRGKNFDELFIHAALALCFDFPPLIQFVESRKIEEFDQMIVELNELISRADAAGGCPFKAVSFHSDQVEKNAIIEWEMIVDV